MISSNAQYLFVTLPARMEIWSTYDEYYGHYKRYDRGSLAGLASQTSFQLVSSGYFFHVLYGAARLMSLVTKKRSVRFSAPKFTLPHAVLGQLFDLEEALAPAGAHGSSVYALFERRLGSL